MLVYHPPEMLIDWTVSVGNLLTVIGFVVGALIFVVTMRSDLRLFTQRLQTIDRNISNLETQMGEMGEVVTQIAIEKTRLDLMSERVTLLDKRVDEMRHGEGFVYPLMRPKPPDG